MIVSELENYFQYHCIQNLYLATAANSKSPKSRVQFPIEPTSALDCTRRRPFISAPISEFRPARFVHPLPNQHTAHQHRTPSRASIRITAHRGGPRRKKNHNNLLAPNDDDDDDEKGKSRDSSGRLARIKLRKYLRSFHAESRPSFDCACVSSAYTYSQS